MINKNSISTVKHLQIENKQYAPGPHRSLKQRFVAINKLHQKQDKTAFCYYS